MRWCVRIPFAVLVLAVLAASAAAFARARLDGTLLCSAWQTDAGPAKSPANVDQWIFDNMRRRAQERPHDVGLILQPDQMLSQAARYCRLHPDRTIADAVEFLWKLVTDPTWLTPPEPAQPQRNAPVRSQFKPRRLAPTFGWPVRGQIIASFCESSDGTPGNGINIAVAEETPIAAADGGIVAYAGDELKGYGNVIILSHPDGYVTAYAHASKLLVRRGDKVERCQVIALAGQTGRVRSPQLHFELRKGSTVLDPIPLLASCPIAGNDVAPRSRLVSRNPQPIHAWCGG
jgi:murein DD-endopeptidase MepM/ murein hydrolase activator NlpD